MKESQEFLCRGITKNYILIIIICMGNEKNFEILDDFEKELNHRLLPSVLEFYNE